MILDPRLLEILACPSCHSPIEVIDDEICCKGCLLAYPIRDQIPVMLIDQARTRQA
jgi:uncharacterized protein YbaR (Trm112 family)